MSAVFHNNNDITKDQQYNTLVLRRSTMNANCSQQSKAFAVSRVCILWWVWWATLYDSWHNKPLSDGNLTLLKLKIRLTLEKARNVISVGAILCRRKGATTAKVRAFSHRFFVSLHIHMHYAATLLTENVDILVYCMAILFLNVSCANHLVM